MDQELDVLERLATIYNNLIGRDRPSDTMNLAMDKLEELISQEVENVFVAIETNKPQPEPEAE